jgi:CheY-like chemotaxis protein
MNAQTSILIVDDNPFMAKTTADILAIHGYAVHTATSGTEALQVIEREIVHILLTDVIMPDMNGVDLFVQVRQHVHKSPITFLMTAYSANDLIQRGRLEGAKAILTKPLDLNLLLKTIEENYSKEEQ